MTGSRSSNRLNLRAAKKADLEPIASCSALRNFSLVYPAFQQHILSEDLLGHLCAASPKLTAKGCTSPRLCCAQHEHCTDGRAAMHVHSPPNGTCRAGNVSAAASTTPGLVPGAATVAAPAEANADCVIRLLHHEEVDRREGHSSVAPAKPAPRSAGTPYTVPHQRPGTRPRRCAGPPLLGCRRHKAVVHPGINAVRPCISLQSKGLHQLDITLPEKSRHQVTFQSRRWVSLHH